MQRKGSQATRRRSLRVTSAGSGVCWGDRNRIGACRARAERERGGDEGTASLQGRAHAGGSVSSGELARFRCSRIRATTVGFSMQAILTALPHRSQAVTSILNTLARRCAHVMATCRGRDTFSPAPGACGGPSPRPRWARKNGFPARTDGFVSALRQTIECLSQRADEGMSGAANSMPPE